MKRLTRDNSNRWLAGFCSGIGRTYDIDPLVVRLSVFFITFVTGIVFGVITYFLAWAITPTSEGTVISRLTGLRKQKLRKAESVDVE